MKLAIYTKELENEKGTWIATVDWYKWDGGEIGAPGAVKYGDSEAEAYNRMKKLLEERGHEVCE